LIIIIISYKIFIIIIEVIIIMSLKLINGGFYYVADNALEQPAANPQNEAEVYYVPAAALKNGLNQNKPEACPFTPGKYIVYTATPQKPTPAREPNPYPLPDEDPREKVARAAKEAAANRARIEEELANAPYNLMILELCKPDPGTRDFSHISSDNFRKADAQKDIGTAQQPVSLLARLRTIFGKN
jgi:hypothetical protein